MTSEDRVPGSLELLLLSFFTETLIWMEEKEEMGRKMGGALHIEKLLMGSQLQTLRTAPKATGFGL